MNEALDDSRDNKGPNEWTTRMWVLTRRILRKTLSVCALPFTALFRVMGVRTLAPHVSMHIGHLVTETFWAVGTTHCEKPRPRVILLLTDPQTVCNPTVVDALPRPIRPLRLPRGPGGLLHAFATSRPVLLDTFEAIAGLNGAAQIFSQTKVFSQGSFLREIGGENELRERLLADLGVASGTPYVCLHIRERGYDAATDAIHDYRNGDFASVFTGLRELVDHGFTVIRMGGAYSGVIPAMPGLIDYATSNQKSHRNDFLLSRGCALFIGNTSGLNTLAGERGIPILGLNMAPLAAFGVMGDPSIAVPKLYARKSSPHAFVPFRELLESPVGSYRDSRLFDSAGINVFDNDEEDIKGAIREMLSISAGEFRLTQEQRSRQERFRSHLNRTHMSFFSSTLISPAFLERHEALLR